MESIKSKRMKNRKRRVRTKVIGTGTCPRLSVFTSNKHVFAQVIDDSKGVTLVAHGDLKKAGKGTKVESSKLVGLEIAKKTKEKKIQKVVFDRGRKLYHGRIKAVAEGAREGGLEF